VVSASSATPVNSTNIISTTGLNPHTAAPTAAPMNPISEIGVSITRSAPYFSRRPSVHLKAPPASAISSPSRMTLASSASASSSA
jgi:hypothetical protein